MKILIITTSGTIGQEKDENHVSISTNVDHAMDFFSSNLIPKDIELSFENLYNCDSSNVTPNHWSKIVKCLIQNHDNYDGFIITHGTNTLDYTCAALTFMLEKFNKPIVLTRSSITTFSITVAMHKQIYQIQFVYFIINIKK